MIDCVIDVAVHEGCSCFIYVDILDEDAAGR